MQLQCNTSVTNQTHILLYYLPNALQDFYITNFLEALPTNQKKITVTHSGCYTEKGGYIYIHAYY